MLYGTEHLQCTRQRVDNGVDRADVGLLTECRVRTGTYPASEGMRYWAGISVKAIPSWQGRGCPRHWHLKQEGWAGVNVHSLPFWLFVQEGKPQVLQQLLVQSETCVHLGPPCCSRPLELGALAFRWGLGTIHCWTDTSHPPAVWLA